MAAVAVGMRGLEAVSTAEEAVAFMVEAAAFTGAVAAVFMEAAAFRVEAPEVAASTEGSPRLPRLVMAGRAFQVLLPCARVADSHPGPAAVTPGQAVTFLAAISDLETPVACRLPYPTGVGIPLGTPQQARGSQRSGLKQA